MAACGQMSAHLLHWMQSDLSQTGTSSAMERFSQRVVPTGQVPSTGKAETGSLSPLPGQHERRDALHEVGRLLGARWACAGGR